MIPFGRETVTWYHRTETIGADGRTAVSWSRHMLFGCSWSARRGALLNDQTLEKEDALVCRIPQNAPGQPSPGQPSPGQPSPGDVFILGAADIEPVDSVHVALMLEAARGRAFRVQKVVDRARIGAPLGHYEVLGV